jgi:hypothetical protein
MSTLESQYNEFLHLNPKSGLSFSEWMKVHSRLLEQAIINMMKADEELGLYDEPFKHKVETIPAEEILANRSNAYEFIDFNKQETVEEYFLDNIKNMLQFKNDALAMRFMEKYYHAKKQQERSCSEEELIQTLIKFNQEIHEVEDVREWFKKIKNK